MRTVICTQVKCLHFKLNPFFTLTGHISLHGVSAWAIYLKTRSNPSLSLQIPRDTVIELGISNIDDQMSEPQYLSFVLPRENLSLSLKAFQKIRPTATVGLIDVFLPKLANIYPPFNFLIFTSGEWEEEENRIDERGISHYIASDFYTDAQIKKKIGKILKSMDIKKRRGAYDGSLLCYGGREGQQVTLHNTLVQMLNVKGEQTRMDASKNRTTFLVEGLKFGKTEEMYTLPNPIFFECDLAQATMVGSKTFQLLRLLYLDKMKKQNEGTVHIFENVQMLPIFPSAVNAIKFKLVDYNGNDVTLANNGQCISGTLIINND